MRLTEARIRQIVRGILRESDESDESTAMQLLGGGQLKGKLEGVVNLFVRKLTSDIAETPEALELLSSFSGPNYGSDIDDDGNVSQAKASFYMTSDDMNIVVTEYMRKRRITQILHKIISRVAPNVADILPHHDLEHVVQSVVTDQIMGGLPDSDTSVRLMKALYPHDTPLMGSLMHMIDSSAQAHEKSQTDPERAQIARERDARWWSEQET